jgi:N-acetylmuramoyl-L-alanine amidase
VRNTNTDAQLLSSIHARKKNMLTPNGCETLVFSKKRKNTDAQLLRFKKTLHRFKFSNETKREKKRPDAHPERLRK